MMGFQKTKQMLKRARRFVDAYSLCLAVQRINKGNESA